MQDTKSLPAPIGIVYNTSMMQPGAALALAAMYVAASRREARVDGVCVTGAGLDAAIFCDLVARFYTGQNRPPSSNTVIPVGFPADPPLAPNPPMVARAIARTRPDGSPQYARSIQRVADTSAPDAMLRNAITFSAETVVVLSAPATWLVRSLELAGTAAQYTQRVKRLVVVENGSGGDMTALKRLTEVAPVPVVTCPRAVGEALTLPVTALETALAWAPAHPVADAIQAARIDPVPLDDLAAVHYALYPDSGFFLVEDGRLALDPAARDACVAELKSVATAKPTPPAGRGIAKFPA